MSDSTVPKSDRDILLTFFEEVSNILDHDDGRGEIHLMVAAARALNDMNGVPALLRN